MCKSESRKRQKSCERKQNIPQRFPLLKRQKSCEKERKKIFNFTGSTNRLIGPDQVQKWRTRRSFAKTKSLPVSTAFSFHTYGFFLFLTASMRSPQPRLPALSKEDSAEEDEGFCLGWSV